MRLSQTFAKGAEATGRAIHKGGGKIRERVTPEETPSVVSPRVTRGLETTQQVTGGAVRVSRFLGKHPDTRRRRQPAGRDVLPLNCFYS